MAAAFFAALIAIVLASAPSVHGAKTGSNGMVGVAISASGQLTKVDEQFDAFAKRHGRSYEQGSDEYAMRLGLYEKRRNEMLEHNGKDGQSYKATLNHFSDLTDLERKQYLGLRPNRKKAATAASMLELSSSHTRSESDSQECTTDNEATTCSSTDFCMSGSCKANPPEARDWVPLLSVATRIADQGSCGSCWAVTSAAMLEAHYEIQRVLTDTSGKTKAKHFSAQELVNCMKNPDECGGQGGCAGATVELAMEYVRLSGLHDEADYPYKGSDGECLQGGANLADGLGGGLGGVASGLVIGHTTLPTNKVKDLMYAMYNFGPVALSVAADNWFMYEAGEFDGCRKEEAMIINHAVLGYGYNATNWKIRNSWGADWGEKGFIFLKRPLNEESYCSDDNEPEKGVGCKNGPASVQVCGMCGILMDSVYPHFAVLLADKLIQDEQAVTVDEAAVIRMEAP